MSIFDEARERVQRGDFTRVPIAVADAGLVPGIGTVGRCQECAALVVLTDSAAHTAWHDGLARATVRWMVSPPSDPAVPS